MADEGDEGSVLTEVHAAARSHFIEVTSPSSGRDTPQPVLFSLKSPSLQS